MRLKSLIRTISKTLYTEIWVRCFRWRVNIWPSDVVFSCKILLFPSREKYDIGTDYEVICVLFPSSRHSTRQALGTRSLKSPRSRLLQSRSPPWACRMCFSPSKASATRCLPREVNSHPSFPHRAWIFLPLQSQETSWNKRACFIAVGCIW